MNGVVRTRVGYTGGTTDSPNYYDLGDHSEAIQVDFDPAQLSFEDLLEEFWNSHDPTATPPSSQYKAAIYVHDDEQRRLALDSRERVARILARDITTEVLPAATFHLAEGYHQKWRLRQVPEIMEEFSRIYPKLEEFVNSTATARVNGYLAGYGSPDDVQRDIERLGLSAHSRERLLKIRRTGR